MVRALRAQIDELNAEMAVASAEADRVLAEERQRADRLNKQMEALSAKVVRAEKQVEAAVGRAEQAEAGRDAEHAEADALRTSIDELKAGQAMMVDMYTRELALARHDVLASQQAAAKLRQAEAARKARGLVARLRAAWRGE
jgi:chromosome segregation ATPase